MKLQYVEAGEIVTTHGIRGEVKVLCWLDDPEMLCEFERCRIGGKEYTMEQVRVQKTCNLVITLLELEDNLHLAKKPEGGKLPMDTKPESFSERAQIVLEVFVTGMLSVFAVLALLWGIIALSKVFLHDIPNAKKNKNKKPVAPVAPAAPAPAIPDAVEATEEVDDGELVAVITAAVAAMIESGDYKNEFANGFRVVSFKRSAKNAWNRK